MLANPEQVRCQTSDFVFNEYATIKCQILPWVVSGLINHILCHYQIIKLGHTKASGRDNLLLVPYKIRGYEA